MLTNNSTRKQKTEKNIQACVAHSPTTRFHSQWQFFLRELVSVSKIVQKFSPDFFSITLRDI